MEYRSLCLQLFCRYPYLLVRTKHLSSRASARRAMVSNVLRFSARGRSRVKPVGKSRSLQRLRSRSHHPLTIVWTPGRCNISPRLHRPSLHWPPVTTDRKYLTRMHNPLPSVLFQDRLNLAGGAVIMDDGTTTTPVLLSSSDPTTSRLSRRALLDMGSLQSFKPLKWMVATSSADASCIRTTMPKA